ncbi:hypothetical protein [uncultured Tenacibaculum sp.]|uniref:hypothetical protein n=1 Tax=uncultured Tenacibaculum sp. TaxID=174713 RepID=UPI0026050EB2|nr:hypothetical protein [uncultured Tenacibaculum sp.]
MKDYKRLMFFLIIFCFFNCIDKKPVYKKLVTVTNSDYELIIGTAKNVKHLDRSHSIGVDEIQLNNTFLKDGLSVLLNKDTSGIIIEDRNKKNLILKGTFKNLKQGANPETTKKAFLKELKKQLKFSLKVAYPGNVFQLVITDTLMLNKHRVHQSKNNKSSILTSPYTNRLEVTNGSLLQISKGLTTIYNESMYSLLLPDINNTYSFKMEDIPFNKLDIYLKENLGLGLLRLNDLSKIKEEEYFIKVIFE